MNSLRRPAEEMPAAGFCAPERRSVENGTVRSRSSAYGDGRGAIGAVKRGLVVGCALGVLLPLFAVHRLALALDWILFPGLRKVVVKRPLFVVGPPRSGTTMMHRLLAENHEQFTTFPLWELLFAPALCEKYFICLIARLDTFVGGPCRRVIRWSEQKFSKSLDGVHQTSLTLPEEDYLGLLPYGGCFLAVLMFPKANWVWRLGDFSNGLAEPRQQQLLDAYRGLLQRHLYYRGTEKAVLSKNPTFSAWIPKLVETFPDARFIGLLRDPLEIVPSQLSSVREGIRFFGNDEREPAIRDAFLKLLASYHRDVREKLTGLPADCGTILEYRQLKHSSDRVVIECLERFGYHVSSVYREALRKQASEVSGYRSGHRYKLEDFSLCKADIEVAFGVTEQQVDSTETNGVTVHS